VYSFGKWVGRMSNEEFLKVYEEVKQYAMENYYSKFIDCEMFGMHNTVTIKFDTKDKLGDDISIGVNFRMFDDLENDKILEEYNEIIKMYENKYGMTDFFIRDETKACGCCAKCYRIINAESYKKLSCNENGEVICWQCRIEKEI